MNISLDFEMRKMLEFSGSLLLDSVRLLDEALDWQMCLFYLMIELDELRESSLEIRLMIITSAFSSFWRFVLTLLIVLGVKIRLELTC